MRLGTLLTSILLVVCSSSVTAGSPKEVDQLHQQVYDLLGSDMDSAMLLTDRSLTMAKAEGYDWGIANSYYIKAYIYDESGEMSKALLMYLKSISVLNDINSEKAIRTSVNQYINIGIIFKNHKKYDESISYYDRGLNLAKKLEDDKLVLRLSYNKARSLVENNQQELAISELERSLEIAKSLDDKRRKIWCLNQLGLAYYELGEMLTAVSYYQKILATDELNEIDKGHAYHNMGLAYRTLDIIESNRHLLKALELQIENKDERSFRTQLELTRNHIISESFEKALEIGNEAMSYYMTVSKDMEFIELFYLLAEASNKTGLHSASMDHMRKYREEQRLFLDQQQKLIDDRDRFQMELLMAGYESDLRSEQEINARNDIIRILGVISIFFLGLLIWYHTQRILLKRSISPIVKNIKKDLNL